MSIVSQLKKIKGVPVAMLAALQKRANERRGMVERPYSAETLFATCFGCTPEDMAAANKVRRARLKSGKRH